MGERGRRPEHLYYRRSGYCGRGCHHPHVHCIVPGGGVSPDGSRWVRCRPGFFLPVRVLSRLFRRLFLEGLRRLHAANQLQFFNDLRRLQDARQFGALLSPLRKGEWVVYAKQPFAGPAQVLAYLARYTHRVAISNSRLVSTDNGKVCFRWKDYRENGTRKTMTLQAGEFIRRFLLHVLPDGFHRIRHYGLFANGHRAEKLALCRKRLDVSATSSDCDDTGTDEVITSTNEPPPCPCCGGRMKLVESFDGTLSRHNHSRRFDSS